ncbi:odorant receptor 94a-like [Ostrinia nubilalis]|uniref:odorant receptor 94a-like n=1 Tax=Ostrinia nubilalis TaxID=29057 RepID=UPI0030826160
MLRNFLLSLENDNHPLLSPTLWGLQKWGLWQPNKGLNSKINNFIHFAATLFVISQYVELWLIRDNLNYALRNLSVTMLSTVCVVKAFTFVTWQDQWKDVIDNVSLLEKRQLSKKDKITDKIISEYTNYARRVTNFYWTLVAATVFTVILAPLVCFLSSPDTRERIRDGYEPYPEIMSSWVPFDRSRGLGYWVTVLEHILICFYGGGIVATYDSNAVVLITFFAGQMKLLSVNCSRLFDDEKEMTYEDDMEKIRACHYHHLMLIKYSKILNSLLSPVMFLYVIICSLMICASGIQLTTEGTTTMQRIWIAEYLMALIAQLFLYCWHSNEALVMSNKVDDGVYASAWWSRSIQVRRCVLLLAGQLRKSVVFTAGPFTKLNVPTFIAILKGSYSYYTLLNNKDD